MSVAHLVPCWKQVRRIVQPETRLRWPRAGFRNFGPLKSRSHQPGPRLEPDTIALIQRLARENRRWCDAWSSSTLLIGLASWRAAIPLSIPLAVSLGNALGLTLLARPLACTVSVPARRLWLGRVIVMAVLASPLAAQHAARLTIR